MGSNCHMLTQLEYQMSTVLHQRSQASRLRTLTLPQPFGIDFSSNDFLSLSKCPDLRIAFFEIFSQFPSAPFGSGGSRLLDGNSVHAEDLEKFIAQHHRGDINGGLLFNSGFDANTGFFACVPQPGDIVLYDEAVHASVYEGLRVSRAKLKIKFKHNSTNDLKKQLEDIVQDRGFSGNIFVAIESVYSMDGDVAPLAEMLTVADEVVPSGALFIVDEAHATGVIGDKGMGLTCALSLEERVFARLHTFGKAMACNGAIILSTPTVRSYLINYARPLIYTTAMSFPAIAAIKASYTLLSDGRTRERQQRLHELVISAYELLETILRPTLSNLVVIPKKSQPLTPILSILTPKPRQLSKFLFERKFIARAIVFPTVDKGRERIRLCIHADNKHEDVARMIHSIKDWVLVESKLGNSKL